MQKTSDSLENLVERVEQYGKTSLELLKLKAIDRSAEIVSSIVKNLAIVTILLLIFTTLNIGMALWIGDLLGKTYFGFFIVAGGYSILGIILYIFRDNLIKRPLRNSIITQVLNQQPPQ